MKNTCDQDKLWILVRKDYGHNTKKHLWWFKTRKAARYFKAYMNTQEDVAYNLRNKISGPFLFKT